MSTKQCTKQILHKAKKTESDITRDYLWQLLNICFKFALKKLMEVINFNSEES